MKQQIMNRAAYVCESDDDISACLNHGLDFGEVFDSWNRGAVYGGDRHIGFDQDYPRLRLGGLAAELVNAKANIELYLPGSSNPLSDLTWYGYTRTGDRQQLGRWVYNINRRHGSNGERECDIGSDGSTNPGHYEYSPGNWAVFSGDYGYGYWAYNSTLSTIIQLKNSFDTTYFYSPQEYDRYHVKMLLRATGMDDDPIGFVAAIGKTPDGRPNPLYVVRRSPTGSNSSKALDGATNWYIIDSWPLQKSLADTLVFEKVGSQISDLNDGTRKLLSDLSNAISSSSDPDGWALSSASDPNSRVILAIN